MVDLGVSGLVSGINSADIIDALVEADRGANRLLAAQKTRLGAKLEAIQTFNTRLLSAQVDLSALKRSATFTAKTVSSSDESVVTATATSSATSGTFRFEVLNRAASHQVATAVQPSLSASMGTGTIGIQVGSGALKEISITAGKSTIGDVAAEINAAKAGVVASVVNDGSGHRLILQGQATGAGNAINIAAVDDNGADGADLGALFGGMTTLQAADDARIRIGSGPGAITLEKPTDTISDVFPGVSLNLKKASVGEVSVTVAADTTTAKEAVGTFIESINGAMAYLKANSSYDPVTKEGGILISEGGLKQAMSRVVSSLLSADPSLPSSRSTLSSVGITIDRNTGALALDSDKLEAALLEDPEGVAKLFGSTGEAADAGVSFATLGRATKAKTFNVEITQAASQAKLTAVGAMVADGGGMITIDETNDHLQVMINNNGLATYLAHGTYTRAELADQVAASINALAPNGSKVVATLDGDTLDLRSKNYGSSQAFRFTGGTANSVLRLATTQAYGQDVVGTIDGQAANGAGQSLIGAEGTDAEGLILIASTATPMSTSMTVRKGFAQRIEEAVAAMTDADAGSLTAKEDSIELQMEGIDKRLVDLDRRSELRRARYQAQFLAMEQLIASFKSQENALQGQISAFENFARSRSSGR